MSGPLNVMGVDPGASGALVVLNPDGSEILAFLDMPFFMVKDKRKIDVHELGRFIAGHAATARAVVELVGAMPGQGVSSMFSFGFSAGVLHGAIGASAMQLETITPRVWKAAYNLGKDKDQARMLASRRWPTSSLFNRVKDAGRAEAALLALYSINRDRF